MEQISTILILLSIFKFVAATFDYKSLAQQTVTHFMVDQIDDETSHPPNFKLDSYVDKISGDPYADVQTFTAKIQRSKFHSPKKVFIKLVILKQRDSDPLIYAYFKNYKTQKGYFHICYLANVMDYAIAYLAIEFDMYKDITRPDIVVNLPNLNQHMIVIDYINKYLDSNEVSSNQLKIFKLGDRIKSERDFLHCFKAKIYKINSTKSIKAVVMIYYCPKAMGQTSEYSINDFLKEISDFQEKYPNRFVRTIKKLFLDGQRIDVLNSAVAIETEESLFPFNRRSFPF